MADTCSGIYFWSWSTSPSGPPPRPPGWRAAAVHERRLEPVLSLRLNSMVTLVVLFIGCVPSLRRRATTSQPLHTDVVPPRRMGGRRGKKGALCLYVRKFLFLREWKFASSICRKFFFLLMGWQDLERFRVKAYRRFFCSKYNLWLELFKDWKKESNI